jgi:hypothetical protein
MRRVAFLAFLLALPALLLVSWSPPGMAQAPPPPPSTFESLRNRLVEAAKAKDYETAERLAREILKVAPDPLARASFTYDLACLQALGKHPREALLTLAEAVRGGSTLPPTPTCAHCAERRSSSSWSQR